MQNLRLEGFQGVPSVFFNVKTGICEITGQSYQERALEFLESLLEHLELYTAKIGGPVTINFRLTYFNSGSSKRILHILDALKEYEKNNGSVVVNWYYDEEDLDMEELVNDFIQISKLKINLVADPQMGL
jgi:hypothetical protein